MMEDLFQFVLGFCQRNWKWIISVIVSLISFIVLLVKRKIKVNDVFTSVLVALPGFINSVEKSGVSGEEKLKHVFSMAIAFIVSISKLDADEAMKKYGEMILTSIENILSTPQKKGV